VRNIWIVFALAAPAWAQGPLVDRVDTTAFIQLQAESFKALSPKQQELAYWLTQAAIAIDPIIYDQTSRFGLRQKHVLEAIVAHPKGVKPEVYAKILDFTKLFWAGRGNHNEMTAQKFLPTFTYEELVEAAKAAGHSDLLEEISKLRQSLFDPEFEPLTTAKSPSGGKDILQSSSNTFYFGVSLADLKGFVEKYALNSRVTKENGKLSEQVDRA
jgi:dipeptidyl-peptidase-3